MEQIIPVFKSHFSFGRSILTLDSPDDCKEGGSDSIIKIAIDNGLKTVFLVEDELIGVPTFLKAAQKFELRPAFGLRLSIRSNPTEALDEHKIVILAKNAAGCKLLNKIFHASFVGDERFITYESLKALWDKEHLSLIIPFYDSFLHYNNLRFGTIVPDLSFADVTLFLEDNDLAIDIPIAEAVLDFAKAFSYPVQKAKSIFYKDRSDIDAFMAYKIICGKVDGRGRSLEKPELPHFCSAEFSFESFKEKLNGI